MGHNNDTRYSRKRGYHSDFEDYESDCKSYSRDNSRSRLSNRRVQAGVFNNNNLNRIRSSSFSRSHYFNQHNQRSNRFREPDRRHRYDSYNHYSNNNENRTYRNRKYDNRTDQPYYGSRRDERRRSDNELSDSLRRRYKQNENIRSRSRMSSNRKARSSSSESSRRSSRRSSRSSYRSKSRSRSRSRSRAASSERTSDRSSSIERYRKHHSSRDQHSRTIEKEKRTKIKDDEDGHLIYQIGDTILERYKILKTVGEGTFGKVVKATDLKKNKKIALKLIKNIEKYRRAAKFEILVLNKLNKWDPHGKHLCVQMLDWFDYYGHVCISFEILGLSLFDFLKQNNYCPYPIDQVRHISYQLCYAVKFLHDHNLSHTDLKPENILFVNSDYTTYYDENLKQNVKVVKSTEIRLIDFGSATFDYEHHSSIITTRHYRSVEVLLQIGWDESCDVWSIGCILFELFKGDALFQTHKDLEHLAMMKRILGPFPKHLIKRSKCKYFDHNCKLEWDSEAPYARYIKKNCKYLFDYIDNDDKEAQQLFDLISLMLIYDPVKRISLRSSLKHKFFNNVSRRVIE